MKQIRLVHWNAEEAEERAARLRALGYDADGSAPVFPASFREMAENPPAALVIDLSRVPSHGREAAVSIRQRKATRQIPIIFVGGEPDKVARIRELLPDAVYTEWDEIGGALEAAIAAPPEKPVVMESQFAAYAGRPLAGKLGIKEGFVVGLIGAPDDFAAALGDLPKGARLENGIQGDRSLAVWFVRSQDNLRECMAEMAEFSRCAPLWIAWPKKASGISSDLTQQAIRDAGLAAGMVDYKICAIDKTWTGLLFTWRKPKERA